MVKRLRIESETHIILIEHVRFIQNQLIVLVTTCFPELRVPHPGHQDMTLQLLYAYLKSACSMVIARSRQSNETIQASEDEARFFEVQLGAP